jgi:plasmid stability protein
MGVSPRATPVLTLTLLLLLFLELHLRSSASISTFSAVTSFWTTYGFGHAPPPWLVPSVPPEHAPLSIRLAIISRPGEREHRDAMRRTVLAGVPQADVHFTYRFFVGVPAHPERFHELAEQPEGVEDSLRVEAAEHGDIELLDLGEGRLYMGTKRWMMLKWVRQTASSVLLHPC